MFDIVEILHSNVFTWTKTDCQHGSVGLESPTHALRADADPSAQSASATYITLAQEHPYDRHIEIILHLSGEQLKKNLPVIFFFLVVWYLVYDFSELFHRTSQPVGHIRERPALVQSVRTADQRPPGFHPLQSQRLGAWEEGWQLLTLSLSAFDISHVPKADMLTFHSTAGVCEEAIPQGHPEQPRPDAQLLSRLVSWTSGAAQSHQRTALPRGSKWQHEWHQHQSCKGAMDKNNHWTGVFRFRSCHPVYYFFFVFVFFHRKPWWWRWRVSPPAPCSTSSASAPPSSPCSPPASSALMLASRHHPAQRKITSCL